MNRLRLIFGRFSSIASPQQGGATSRQQSLLQQESDESHSRLMAALHELEARMPVGKKGTFSDVVRSR